MKRFMSKACGKCGGSTGLELSLFSGIYFGFGQREAKPRNIRNRHITVLWSIGWFVKELLRFLSSDQEFHAWYR